MSAFSAPAHVASQIASSISTLFRHGTISSSTGLTATTFSFSGQAYPVSMTILPYAIGEVPVANDETIVVQIEGQPMLLGKLVRSGITPSYSPIPLVASLPTAGAAYRGVHLRLAGASGVADATYVCGKTTSDTYTWVLDTTPNPPLQAVVNVASLPTASVTYRGIMLLVEGGSGVADNLYICMKSSSGTYSWKVVSTG